MVKTFSPRLFGCLFSCMIICFNTIYAQRSKKNIDLESSAITMFVKEKNKKRVKIWLINLQDSSKFVVSRKVFRKYNYHYIKLNNQFYYLDVESPANLYDEVCEEFAKIKLDTILRYGEPMAKGSVLAFVINSQGDVLCTGLARPGPDPYYEAATLRLVEKFRTSKTKPATVNNVPVNSILRVSFIYGSNSCKLSVF